MLLNIALKVKIANVNRVPSVWQSHANLSLQNGQDMNQVSQFINLDQEFAERK